MSWQIAGMVALLASGAPLVWRTVRGMARGRFDTDIVATLSIVTAALLQQPIAGLVIVLMQRGGEWLERYAARRATRAIQALEDASPRSAHRVTGNRTDDITVEEIRVDDVLLIRPSELVPADGIVVSGTSWIDASRLTGDMPPEPLSGLSAVAGEAP